jgi:regulator of cell morphogenesis and NO signaling
MSTWTTRTTVGQLVTERPARARIFERLGIDYCCGGRLPLADACAKRGLDPDTVADQIRADDQAADAPDDGPDWAAASASDLADHIEATHHARLREQLPRLTAMAVKVAQVHGGRHPSLVQLRNVFERFALELNSHMAKEERILFPWIRLLEHNADGAPAGVSNPVAQMIHEHDDAGDDLAQMRALTNGFTPPPDACGTWRVLLDELRQLEADMHQHVHKENNILFPKAIELDRARAADAASSCSCGIRCRDEG